MKKRFSVLAMLFVCPVGLALLAGARGAELNDAQQRSLIGYATCLHCVTAAGGGMCQPTYIDINAVNPVTGISIYPCDSEHAWNTQSICTDDAVAKNCEAHNLPGNCTANNHSCAGVKIYTCTEYIDSYGHKSYQWEFDSNSSGTSQYCGESSVPSCG